MIANQIGDYVFIKELGKGSLGTTYLAEHTFLKRLFAIKILPNELTQDADFLKRFERHIALLSQLDHPHIASIHNATRLQDHYVILSDAIADPSGAMRNLKQYLEHKRQELSEEEILRIARQLASAIDYAHSVSDTLSHGMIKWNNICITQGNEGVQAVLTDFGLSKLLGPAISFGRTLCDIAHTLAEGQPLHSSEQVAHLRDSFCQNFAFLAPEQKMNFSQHHPKADTYAFGILLYYLLVGEFPEGYFDLPSKRLGELKWNWDLLICKCLQTDPSKRPDQLFLKLDELLATASQTARNQLNKMRSSSEESPAAARPILRPKEIARPAFDADPGAIFQMETAVALYKPKTQEQKEIEPLLNEMSIIPSGSYLRGSNHGGRDEMPRHTIQLNSFAIDIHPVTNEQFVCFLEAMGGEKDVNNNDIIRLRESRIKRSGGSLNIESGYARHPVVGVTWYGALAYTKWVGKRLPTEAEWEIAAYGANEDYLYPTGDRVERSDANFFSSDTTSVMSYRPNGYGLYDIAGNVYEWCHDWYDFHYYDMSVQEPNNPKGPLQGVYRVLRGGCWKSLKEDLRCAHRHRNNPGVMNGTYGFRCAADVTSAV
ncbi:MAG TPA: bifunctional serine/threonine-protein kinase/formylglycine-generating enzyme family protein [Rhabdochlamydiaceae bacterium]|jgi:formylglycine-generating enzyme required for sulfatase activity